MSNTRSSLKTGDEEKQVFKSFIEDLDQSLKPHKRVYAIAHRNWRRNKKSLSSFHEGDKLQRTLHRYPFVNSTIPRFLPSCPHIFWATPSIPHLAMVPRHKHPKPPPRSPKWAILGALIWISIKYNLLERQRSSAS